MPRNNLLICVFFINLTEEMKNDWAKEGLYQMRKGERL